MPKLLVLTSFIFLFSSTLLSGNNYFYYSPKGQESLVLSHTKILIQFSEETTLARQQEILTAHKYVAPLQADALLPSPKVTFADLVDVESDEQVLDLLKDLRTYSSVKFAYPVFDYSDGTQMGLQAKLLIRLKSEDQYPILESMALRYNLVITKENDFDSLLFHVAIQDATVDPLLLSQELFAAKLFDYVEPDFLRFLNPMSTNDPALGSQWSIENTGQNSGTPGIAGADMKIIEAWEMTTGKPSVKIAIIDEGVDLNHPDLVDNIVMGYDATEQNSGGAPSGNDAHGTACAGIAAAVGNNNLGMAGVAYDSQIIPVRLAYSDGENWVTSSAWVSNAINWSWQEAEADVLSNSWGGGGSSFSINNAIDNAITQGRNGLGAPVLFATGNEDTAVSYPADYAPTIAVGAMSMCYERKTPSSCDNETWWGSNYGTHLDVVAPGTRIHATDISGTAGYSSSDYAAYFNGTSAATPNAAGVLALIISANENLTEQQARFALESTCRKVGNYTYNDGVSGQPTGSWNEEMGYGLVDAAAAIQAVAPSQQDDAGIMEIISPTASVCGTAIQPVVRLRNNGSNVLQSAKIHTRVSGGEIRTHQWSGNLASTEVVEISLPTVPVSAAAHTLEIYTSAPNGKTDSNSANDRAFATFSIGDEEFLLKVVLDNYGSETSWDVKNSERAVILSGGPYEDNAVGQQQDENFCLPAGCYTLTFYDEYDDGMCCGYGDGSYELTQLSNGTVFATGGQYTDQMVHEFCFETTSEQEPTPDPLTATITNVSNVRCAGDNSGTATVNVAGGTTPYTYQWSNGSTQATANNLAAGNHQVTVKDATNQTLTKEIFIEEPNTLQVSLTSESAIDNENGSATAAANGGVAPYIYQWSNGGRSANINELSSGIYTVTVTDQNDCSKVASVTVENDETPALQVTITNIRAVRCHGNADGSATANVTGGFPPYSYQWSDGNTSATANDLPAGMQEVTVTDSKEQSVVKTFFVEEPTAIQVATTAQDAVDNQNGSATAAANGGVAPYIYQWSNGGTTATINNLSGGIYVVTVTDQNDCSTTKSVMVNNENTPELVVTISDIQVIDCHGNQNGKAKATVTGGVAPYTFLWSNGSTATEVNNLPEGEFYVAVRDGEGRAARAEAFMEAPTAISLQTTSQTAVDNQGGAASVSATGGTSPYRYLWSNGKTISQINNVASGDYGVTVTDRNGCTQTTTVTIDNENTPDPEPELTPAIIFENGQISALGNNWQTITLKHTYESMVVVASVRLPNVDVVPVVTRIKEAEGNQFSIKLQNPAGASFAPLMVDYFVVEEGVYNEADHGIKMEAVKTLSKTTASRNGWIRERQTYENSYTEPVVLGQVMSHNDEDWSVFWSSSNRRRNAAPNANSFAAGKHVGEDSNSNRANETIGYVVFETGIQQINDTKFYTALGADQIRGVSNTTNGYSYNVNGLTSASMGVLSAAGMDSNNGGWPVFLGDNAVSGTDIRLVFDEDQQRDVERAHTTEQVAFIVFEDEMAEEEEVAPLVLEYGQLAAVNSQWQRVELDNSYESMVVVATVVMEGQEQLPAVTRISEAVGNSFLIKIQNPGGQDGGNYQVQYFVVEEGVYNEFDHGVTLEAVKTISTKTSARRKWEFESRNYQNNYTTPVVLGQVMTYNDERWSMFWANNGNRKKVPTATKLSIGKHVGEDPVQERADETIGYVVFEAGTGELNGVSFSAGVGEDRVYGIDNTRSGYRYEVSGTTANSTAILSSAAMDGSDCGWPVLYSDDAIDTDQLVMVIDEDDAQDDERAHSSEQVAYIVFDIENTIGFTANTPDNEDDENSDSTLTEYATELTPSLITYPNPTIDWVIVESNQILVGATTLQIFNTTGQVIDQQIIQLDPLAKQQIKLVVSNLSSGQYFVRVQNEHQSFITSFTKQ